MEHDSLEQLRQQPQPPAHLESRVLEAVRASGALRQHDRFGRGWLAAAAIVIFTSGVMTGRLWPPGQSTPGPSARSSFLLLLGGDVAPSVDGSSRSAEYGAWARQVAASGVNVRGAELAEGGRVITGDRSTPESLAALMSVGGYFIVDAASEADAVALAGTSPHVKYGGSVVVRRLTGS